MAPAQIKVWLQYWAAAGMVAVKEIQSPADVNTARRFCRCMNVGNFAQVSDGAIWRALEEMRAEPSGVR